MTVLYCFALVAVGLISWSPATLTKMIGNLTNRARYATTYVIVLGLLSIMCLSLSPTRNIQASHGWGMILCGIVVCIVAPPAAAWLDARILQDVTGRLVASRPKPQAAMPNYRSGAASTQQPVWAARAQVARSIQNMPLWQLLIIAAGEEVGFRLGVPIVALRATPQWFALTFFGAALFACNHSVFGRGQILAKVPLAALGTVLFLYWGLWACVMAHIVYNAQYWWNRNSTHRRRTPSA